MHIAHRLVCPEGVHKILVDTSESHRQQYRNKFQRSHRATHTHKWIALENRCRTAHVEKSHGIIEFYTKAKCKNEFFFLERNEGRSGYKTIQVVCCWRCEQNEKYATNKYECKENGKRKNSERNISYFKRRKRWDDGKCTGNDENKIDCDVTV